MENIILFGASEFGKVAIDCLKYHANILFFVDNDKNKWNTKFYGYWIKPVDELEHIDSKAKIVISSQYFEEIEIQLQNMNILNYVYIKEIFYDKEYKCMDIMSANVDKLETKNGWMNHILGNYEAIEYKKALQKVHTILDVGSGCGKQLFNWLCKGYEAHGIEICEWKLEFCNQKIDDLGFPQRWKDNIHFAYGEELPFEDNSFDAVTSWYVLEHVNDYTKCVQEMFRVVKKNGVIIINGPDYRNRFEEHYLIDFGKPLVDNKEEFRQYLMEHKFDTTIYDELNFITKEMVLEELNKCKERMNVEFEILDMDELYPEYRQDYLDYKIAYIIYLK